MAVHRLWHISLSICTLFITASAQCDKELTVTVPIQNVTVQPGIVRRGIPLAVGSGVAQKMSMEVNGYILSSALYRLH
jgi:hypothetical protein